MNFEQMKMFYQISHYHEKKTTINKIFEYSQLSSGLRKQNGFAKDQYKFFKDQCHYQH